MRRLSPTPARAGMTLIELLVVMMIIATLASLVLSAVFTVRDAQTKNFTEATIQKVASALDQQWKAAIDQIREEPVAPWAINLAGGDPLRSRVIYVKARLAQEFPVTFDQALKPMGAFLPPKPAYKNLPPSSAGTQPVESSVLLFLAVSQARRGMAAFGGEQVDATAQKTVTIGTQNYSYFVDAWGNPLQHFTFPFDNDELNALPYLPVDPYTHLPRTVGRDPLDPDDALVQNGWRYANGQAPPLSNNALAFGQLLHRIPNPSDPNPSVAGNPNVARNLIPVVASSGRDGKWGLGVPSMAVTNQNDANDNIYSYRLRRSGQRGD